MWLEEGLCQLIQSEVCSSFRDKLATDIATTSLWYAVSDLWNDLSAHDDVKTDLLLIYRSSFRTYEKYKVFSPDKTKAYCNLEAVLLDTRTGIVPFTILVNRTFTAEQEQSDMSFYETIRKAELLALESALTEVGVEVVRFLSEKEI